MNARALIAVLATTTVLVAGCGSGGTGSAGGSPSASSSAGTSMKGMDMSQTDAGSGPSETASMICGGEIRTAVRKNLALANQPRPTHTWAQATRVFTCTYRLPGGTLRLSVNDARDAATGREYFDRLRSDLPGAKAIGGMESFGFPSFANSRGNAVFLKDGKTLRVDASGLRRASLPAGFSREDAAYGVASAVIACWSE